MNVKTLLVALCIISSVSVTGCRKQVDNIEIVSYDDYNLRIESTKEYVISLGVKGIYVLDGKYQVLGKTGTPGVLLGYTKLYLFDISEALRRHPELVSERTTKSAAKQSKLIEKWKKDNEQRKTP